MDRLFRALVGLAVGGVLLLSAPQARAIAHLWHIDEIFSDAGGSVQFIEFLGESDSQNFLASFQASLQSTTQVFFFPNDLPSQQTMDRHFLVGTASYVGTPGAAVPDYVVPDHFFSVNGDTIVFAVGVQVFEVVSFGPEELPADGVLSLQIDDQGGFSTAPNSPTNFAGGEGSVGALPECSDGIDNDGDGRTDFDPLTFANPGDENTLPSGQGDPGCLSPTYFTEAPQCQDGVHNDGDGKMDYDAGLSANGVADPAGPDAQCVGKPWRNNEKKSCGIGFELAFVLPPLMWLHRRRRRVNA